MVCPRHRAPGNRSPVRGGRASGLRTFSGPQGLAASLSWGWAGGSGGENHGSSQAPSSGLGLGQGSWGLGTAGVGPSEGWWATPMLCLTGKWLQYHCHCGGRESHSSKGCSSG